jgi:hypothetical protein
MTLDLSKIDAEIERLENIRRVMSDPRSAQLIEEMLAGRNGRVEPLKFDAKKPSQSAIVRRCLTSLTGRFTVNTVGEAIRAAGPRIENVAIGRVLIRMAENEELVVVQKGSGTQPNVYEKTETFREMK